MYIFYKAVIKDIDFRFLLRMVILEIILRKWGNKMRKIKIVAYLTVVAAIIVLTACGGKSSDALIPATGDNILTHSFELLRELF